ncbi:hypothetical protein ACFRCW_30495 [Streptomyces sp. NPDC056653]|uniref:hypothetical protein n=1 Tax=Streptomyces sp. NPDC056653 TaxID=3345894 RepID=UPI003678A582
MLYCNLDYWKNRDTTEKCGNGLWIADPGAASRHPRITYSWVVHQYGIRNHTDVNVCNFATVQAWRDWASARRPQADRSQAAHAQVGQLLDQVGILQQHGPARLRP